MNCKVIAYYTNDFYMEKSQELSRSLDKFGVTYEIKKVYGPQNWQEAVSYKPRFILDCLLSTSAEYVLYTDSDSKLVRSIPAVELVGDVAYFPFKRSPHHEEEALTGTLVFRNTPEVRSFVLDWFNATAAWQHTFTPEQHSLVEVMSRSKLTFQRLGPEWCFIFDDMREMYPDAAPIFEHYQASREYKEREAKAQVPNVQREGEPNGHLGDASEWTRAKGIK